MKWFVKCIKNYANFNGRARRSEFWYFMLFVILFMIVAQMLDVVLFSSGPRVFSAAFKVFIFLPQLSVAVRRLHDTGRSGMIMLRYYIVLFALQFILFISNHVYGTNVGSFERETSLNLVVVLGVAVALGVLVFSICIIVWWCRDGDKGANDYGPDPKLEPENI